MKSLIDEVRNSKGEGINTLKETLARKQKTQIQIPRVHEFSSATEELEDSTIGRSPVYNGPLSPWSNNSGSWRRYAAVLKLNYSARAMQVKNPDTSIIYL